MPQFNKKYTRVFLENLVRIEESNVGISLKTINVINNKKEHIGPSDTYDAYRVSCRAVGVDVGDMDYADVLDVMQVYREDEHLCTLGNMERAFDLYNETATTLTLDDLTPIAPRPFEDKLCDFLVNVIHLILSSLPLEDIVRAQLVSRRFQSVIRNGSTWKLFFAKMNIAIPKVLESVISSPRACSYLLKSSRRANLFKDFWNSFNKSQMRNFSKHGNEHFCCVKIHFINPWNRDMKISYHTNENPFNIKTTLINSSFQNMWLMADLNTKEVKVVDDEIQFIDLDIESNDDENVILFLDRLYDSFIVLPSVGNKLLIPRGMMQSDLQFIRELMRQDT